MITIVVGLIMLYMGFKMGGKYQDFQDIMLARRVAKLVSQREQVGKDQEDYERAVRVDRKIASREAKLKNEDGELI